MSIVNQIKFLFVENPLLFYICVFILGSIIGSFLNVCIYRIPPKESIIKPGSRCPKCKKAVRWYDNIPIFSFIILKGRCRYCNERISFVYPVVEILSATFACLCLQRFGLSFYFLIFYYFTSVLIVISFIDLAHRIIPDIISIPNIFVGILFSFLLTHISWKESLLGAALGFGVLFAISYIYYLITKREGLGGGDIKLMAVIGAFLGYKALLPVLLISSVLGSIVGLTILLIKRKGLRYAIPFGPFISIGAVSVVLFYDMVQKFFNLLRFFII